MQERQIKILKAVIREHQRTGLPVSSQLLAEKYGLGFSPATLRAEMLILDDEGFLEQPHTSAGRVPTDKAFRFFIREFDDEGVSQTEKEQIWERMEQFQRQSLREAARFLADCSRHLGISGLLDPRADFHEAGLRWLAEEPEFGETERREILGCLDSMEKDISGLFDDLDEEVSIFIGRENPIRSLRCCSLMITAFGQDRERGVLGILGPKRMNYQKNKFVLEETRKKIGKKHGIKS